MSQDSYDAILAALFSFLGEKTLIMATHQLSGIEKFDMVLVMGDKTLLECDCPATLLQDPSRHFNKLFEGSQCRVNNSTNARIKHQLIQTMLFSYAYVITSH